MNVLVFKSLLKLLTSFLWHHCGSTGFNPSLSDSQHGLGTRLHQALNRWMLTLEIDNWLLSILEIWCLCL